MLGREADLDGILALIDDPSRRLITVTGAGGVGKTRLAVHIATTMVDEFERDVVYVPLASVREADLVLLTIGQALDLTFDVNETIEDQLVQAIAKRSRLLLILDNFEQLLGAAQGVGRLLARCPGATILITSQTALAIPGEQLFPLLPLPTPPLEHTSAESILRSDAVALFIARARAVKPALAVDDRQAATIAEICRRLDGLPLAIELAAARTNILSPNALLARLSNRLHVLQGERRGVPDRLRTMRHAIAWSYDLLTAAEQALFRQLAVFAGGFSLDAVERLFQKAEDGRDSLTVLGALVDHSLVQAHASSVGEARFLMLETLREYGLEQLDLRGEVTAAHVAHATYFQGLAEEAEPHLTGSGQEAWLNRLEPEWENFRVAVDWTLAHGQPRFALRITGATWRFSLARGHLAEGRDWIARALDATPEDATADRIRGLNGGGYLAVNQADLDAAQAGFEEARSLASDIGHQAGEHLALIGLGQVAQNRSEFDQAITYQSQALEIANELGEPRAIGIALGNMGYVSYFQGKTEDTERFWEEARRIVASLGDQVAEAVTSSNLGTLALEQGDFERAETLLSRALELQRRLDDSVTIPTTLTNLADTWHHLGDYTLANDLFAEVVGRFRNNGNRGSEGTCLSSYALLAVAESDFPRAASMLLESTRLVMEMGEQFTITENADLLAEIATAQGKYVAAIELLAGSDTLRRALGSAPKPVKQAQLARINQVLKRNVNDSLYRHHWLVGADLDLVALSRRISIVARDIIGPKQIQPLLTEPTDATPAPSHSLTTRELQVLRLLTQGLSTREISEALYISPRTATTHINNIFGKLEVSSRAAAVAYAMRSGLA